jgi:hypothetical protein
VKLSDLMPRVSRAVRAVVTDAPAHMLMSDLHDAAQALFEDAKVLRRSMTLDLQAGVSEYLLDECPGQGLLWRELVSPMQAIASCESVAWYREHHTIKVSPTPLHDKPAGLALEFTVTVNAEVPDEVLAPFLDDTNFRDALVAGAAMRALQDLQPAAAQGHTQRYEALKTKIVFR